MATPPNPMMAQAQQALQSPMTSAVPQTSPIEQLANHPVIQALIKSLSAGAQGFGWSAMYPQERTQRTELEQQKAEAMGRLAGQQQQLALEGQRVGIEAGRAGEEARHNVAAETTAAAGQKATEKFQTGELAESHARTGIEQQRADQEYNQKKQELDLQGKQLEETTRFHQQSGSLERERNNIMAKDAQTAASRVQMEEDHFNKQTELQGLQLSRQVIQDQRKATHDVLDNYYKEHPTLGMLQGRDSIMKMHQGIDAYYDDKLRQGANVGSPNATNPDISGAMGTLNNALRMKQQMHGATP